MVSLRLPLIGGQHQAHKEKMVFAMGGQQGPDMVRAGVIAVGVLSRQASLTTLQRRIFLNADRPANLFRRRGSVDVKRSSECACACSASAELRSRAFESLWV